MATALLLLENTLAVWPEIDPQLEQRVAAVGARLAAARARRDRFRRRGERQPAIGCLARGRCEDDPRGGRGPSPRQPEHRADHARGVLHRRGAARSGATHARRSRRFTAPWWFWISTGRRSWRSAAVKRSAALQAGRTASDVGAARARVRAVRALRVRRTPRRGQRRVRRDHAACAGAAALVRRRQHDARTGNAGCNVAPDAGDGRCGRAAAPDDGPVDVPGDPELLGIFLEEAKEVLATIAQNLVALRQRPTMPRRWERSAARSIRSRAAAAWSA